MTKKQPYGMWAGNRFRTSQEHLEDVRKVIRFWAENLVARFSAGGRILLCQRIPLSGRTIGMDSSARNAK
jgi:hypothetical protein